MKMYFVLSVACFALFLSPVITLDISRLEKNLELNLEERRLRLERLGEHLQIVKEDRNNPVKVTSTVKQDYVKGAESIVEINQKSGIAKYLFQADMHLNDYQLENLERSLRREKSGSSRSKRQAERFAHRWTGGKVYYYFDGTINEQKVRPIEKAMNYLESNTCIRFFKNETNQNRIKFTSDDASCYSMVGMQCKEQILSIGDSCESMGTVVHELMHALGYIHTQVRPDRHQYVQINHENVMKSGWRDFVRYPDEEIITYAPYEYGSIMHYAADSFNISSDIPTIIPNDRNYLYTMGGDIISFWDVLMINEYYGCSGKCNAENSVKCFNDGVPNPNNCTRCICPLGYGGDLCDQRPDECGTVLEAETTWKSQIIHVGNESYKLVLNDYFSFCNYWIDAPEDGRIQIRLDTEMFNAPCRYGCNINGIEFKVNKDKQQTNPRYCCESAPSQIITSELNPLPVIAYNRHYVSKFIIHYRYVLEHSDATTESTIPTTVPEETTMITEDREETIITTGGSDGPSITTEMSIKPTFTTTPTESDCTDEWDTPACDGLARMGLCGQFVEKCQRTCFQCKLE